MGRQIRLPWVVPAVFQLASIVAALFSAGWLLESLWFACNAHCATGWSSGSRLERGHGGTWLVFAPWSSIL
jgi:hypothetical protein